MTNDSITNKLSELFELYKSGALTKEEYERLKGQILSEGGVDIVESEKKRESEITKSTDKSTQVLSEAEVKSIEPEKKQELEITKSTDKPLQVLSEEKVVNAEPTKKQEQETVKTADKPIQVKKGSKIWILVIVGMIAIVVALLVFGTDLFSGKSGSTGQKTQTVKDNDGNVYKTVTIGDQVWMTENLKTTRFNDGTPINLVTDNTAWEALNTPAYCWYNNETANKNTYGALYNWFTVNTNKLCPKGWHVSTNEEWTTLITYLGGEDVAGGKLKAAGTTHWQSPNTGATNETGFTALPTGYLHHLGTFKGIGSLDYWWSASEYDATHAWNSNVSYNLSKVNRNNFMFQNGLSVRCLQDLNKPKNNIIVNNNPVPENKTAVWDSASATKIIMDELSKYPDALNHGESLKNLYKIAPNNYGLLIKGSDGAAGSSYSTKDLYAFINGELKLILSISQRWYNVNSFGEVNLKFNFITKSDGYYDIESIDKVTLEDGTETVKTTIYKFNGIEYVKGNNIVSDLKRDPRAKDVANVFWNPEYTLFCKLTDEPIYPDSEGKYDIWYASHEEPYPHHQLLTKEELPNLLFYKFKDSETCKKWCDAKKQSK